MLGLIGVFAVARIVLTYTPVAAGQTGRSAVLLREYLDAFIVAGLVALFLITFVLRTFYIPSGSMIPTLQEHDVLLVNEFAYRFGAPHRGDIVVFRPPIQSSDNFIKRIIAVPGDTLRVNNGTVYVNGKALHEPYIAQAPQYTLMIKNYGIYVTAQGDPNGALSPLDPAQANIPPRKDWSAPNRVPPNCYFVMGDNRNDSDDSHIWGFAQMRGRFVAGPLAKQSTTAQFTGRAFLLLWPFHRMRILD